MSMFSKQKNIIFISRTHLRVARVFLGRRESMEVIEDAPWSKETLLQTLVTVCQKIGSDVRIVLGEDLGYVVSFVLKDTVAYDRLIIKQEAQGCIPENLDEVAWDFQGIAALIGDKRIGVSNGVQVVAVSKFFLHDIAPIFVEAGFIVEALETESCALARLMRDKNDPVLVVYADHKRSLLVVLNRGVVIATKSIPVSVSSDHIEKLIVSVQQEFSFRIASIIVSAEIPGVFSDMVSALQGKGFSVQEVLMHPVIGIARKTDIKGNDEDVLNVDILPKEKQKPIKFTLRAGEKRLVYVFLLLSTLSLAGIFFLRQSSRSKVILATPAVETVLPQTVSDAVEINVLQKESVVVVEQPGKITTQNSSAYTVRILNGSGKKGEAAHMEELLKSQWFSTVIIGNADNAHYIKTVVRVKRTVPQTLMSTIIQTLSSQYVMDDTGTLDDDAEDDIIIVIGSQKTE